MKFSINAETIVDGTAVGRNCPLSPTQEELDVTWRSLNHIAKKLGRAAKMIEVLKASFHQYHDSGHPFEHGDRNGRYLIAELKAVLVVPGRYHIEKLEVRAGVDTLLLSEDSEAATKDFQKRIRVEIQRAIATTKNSMQTMIDML